jgi:hypothetical protein
VPLLFPSHASKTCSDTASPCCMVNVVVAFLFRHQESTTGRTALAPLASTKTQEVVYAGGPTRMSAPQHQQPHRHPSTRIIMIIIIIIRLLRGTIHNNKNHHPSTMIIIIFIRPLRGTSHNNKNHHRCPQATTKSLPKSKFEEVDVRTHACSVIHHALYWWG